MVVEDMKGREIEKVGKLKAKNTVVPGGEEQQEEPKVTKTGHERMESWAET